MRLRFGRHSPCWVYLIREGGSRPHLWREERYFKVGITTTSTRKRLSSVQNGNPRTLVLVRTVLFSSVPAAYAVEQTFIALSKRIGHHTQYEWIYTSQGAAELLLDRVVEYYHDDRINRQWLNNHSRAADA